MTQTTPILNQINIVASDFDASVRFYRRLGIDSPDRSTSDQGIRHAEATLPDGMSLECDDHQLARIHNAA